MRGSCCLLGFGKKRKSTKKSKARGFPEREWNVDSQTAIKGGRKGVFPCLAVVLHKFLLFFSIGHLDYPFPTG